MCFMPVADPKTVKNRVHLDLTSSAADRDQEIDRLLALGTRRVDIGQTGPGTENRRQTLSAAEADGEDVTGGTRVLGRSSAPSRAGRP